MEIIIRTVESWRGFILGILIGEWRAYTPWIDFDGLRNRTIAGAVFFPLVLEFLLKTHFIIKNSKNEYNITSTGILDYKDRVNTKTLI